jgi:uroporphyrinogen decarboxylase
MNQEQWEVIKKCAALQPPPATPVALIVDSPWIPGYLGISTIDYLSMPQTWLEANLKARIREAGHVVKIVAARGPLAVATHLRGVSNFLVGLKLDPANTHRLLRITARLSRDWLEAQGEALSAVEGILLLDDIVGFLSPNDYQEFAHPYLKEIFDAFPGWVKIFHNDMDNPVSYPHLGELGVQIFNLTHKIDLAEARRYVGSLVCLMGNVAPLDILCNGSPVQVAAQARACLESHADGAGLILSAGGGVSPGTPGENITALADAAREYDLRRRAAQNSQVQISGKGNSQ